MGRYYNMTIIKTKRLTLLAGALLMAPLLSSCGANGVIFCDTFAQIEDLLLHQYEGYPNKRTLHINFDKGVGLEGVELEEYQFYYRFGNSVFEHLLPSNYENEVSNGYRLFDPDLKDKYAFEGWAPSFSWLGKEEWGIRLFPVEVEKFVKPVLAWEGDELKSGGTAFAAIYPPDSMPESDILRIKANVLDYANASLGI